MLQQVETTLQQELEQASNSSVKQTDIQQNQTKTTNVTSESITAKQTLPSESINKALKALQTRTKSRRGTCTSKKRINK